LIAKYYSFQVGSVSCTVLLDDATMIGKDRLLKRFPHGTEAEYRQAYADIGLTLDEADSSFNILVMKIGGETVLVDTGEGGKPNGGLLPESLRLAGIKPEEITLIVLTHADRDHVLGLLTDDHQPAFPNAAYVLSKKEMEHWQSQITADQLLMVSMMYQKGLRLIDMDEQILPGLTAVPLPGHTPGHIGLLLESDGEKLLHLADLMHSPMQFAHPDWSPRYDVDPLRSIVTRRSALARAADESVLTLFYHLTFPGLGWVKITEKGFRWEATAI
jgi:glyoxylase-like metal-dependent hydrolase (beta-lactamase superfamily II)